MSFEIKKVLDRGNPIVARLSVQILEILNQYNVSKEIQDKVGDLYMNSLRKLSQFRFFDQFVARHIYARGGETLGTGVARRREGQTSRSALALAPLPAAQIPISSDRHVKNCSWLNKHDIAILAHHSVNGTRYGLRPSRARYLERYNSRVSKGDSN